MSNQKIQAAVVQADRAASTRKTSFNVGSAMANISGVAAVQQADFATTLGQLATTVAADVSEADRGYDIQRGIIKTQLEELEQVSACRC